VEKDAYLQAARERFYAALTDSDPASAGSVWDEVAEKIGGVTWESLPSPHDAVRAFGVLATLRTGKITVKTRIPFCDLPQLANSMLLEPRNRRCWTHAFKLLVRTFRPSLLRVKSVAQKCNRNDGEQNASSPPDLTAGQVFNVFFPEGSFGRLRREAGNRG
jgi:hypothetical protein